MIDDWYATGKQYQQYMEQQAAEQARAVPVADADMTDGTLPQVHAQAEGADPSSRTSQKRKADQNGGDEDSADTSRNAAAVETTADEGAAAKKSKVADVKKLTRYVVIRPFEISGER